MHVANIKITTTWATLKSLLTTALGTSFTFDVSKTYYLTNNGASTIVMIDTETAPLSTSSDGVCVPPDPCYPVNYGKGTGTVYAKTLSGSANLNVSYKG